MQILKTSSNKVIGGLLLDFIGPNFSGNKGENKCFLVYKCISILKVIVLYYHISQMDHSIFAAN